MHRSVFASMGYLHRAMTGFAVLVFLVTTSALAQQPSDVACKLLQPAEIESALGGKTTNKPSGFTFNNRGEVLSSCSTEMTGYRAVTINLIQNLPVDGGLAIRRIVSEVARQEQWKVKGAQFAEKTVGNATCTMYGRPNVPDFTECKIPRGRAYVQVEVKVPEQKQMASMDVVAALVQKAYTRW